MNFENFREVERERAVFVEADVTSDIRGSFLVVKDRALPLGVNVDGMSYRVRFSVPVGEVTDPEDKSRETFIANEVEGHSGVFALKKGVSVHFDTEYAGDDIHKPFSRYDEFFLPAIVRELVPYAAK